MLDVLDVLGVVEEQACDRPAHAVHPHLVAEVPEEEHDLLCPPDCEAGDQDGPSTVDDLFDLREEIPLGVLPGGVQAPAVRSLDEEVGAVMGLGPSDQPLGFGVYVPGVDRGHILLELEHGGSGYVPCIEHLDVDMVDADLIVVRHRHDCLHILSMSPEV